MANIKYKIIKPGDLKETHLSLVRSMRGEVLYADGRRPEFKNGLSFDDDDKLDHISYHILAWDKKKVVGCLRITPLRFPITQSNILNLIGEEKFLELCQPFMLDNSFFAEASRWLVLPKYTRLKIGTNLMLNAWALILHFQYTCLFFSGDATNYLLKEFGASLIANEKPFFSEKYNDYIKFGVFDYKNPPAKLLARINAAIENLTQLISK